MFCPKDSQTSIITDLQKYHSVLAYVKGQGAIPDQTPSIYKKTPYKKIDFDQKLADMMINID